MSQGGFLFPCKNRVTILLMCVRRREAGGDVPPALFLSFKKDLTQLNKAAIQNIDLCRKEPPRCGVALSDY